MVNQDEISKSDCNIIANKIRSDIFEPAFTFKTTIFLCGKDIRDKTSIRYRVADALTNRYWYSAYYDLIYPEDIFDELLYSSSASDLLSLENLLADSVDAVVVIPESAGSFTELGAFANSEKLRSKLICIVDNKYKKDKSFINQGPIKLIKNVNKGAVIYIDEAKLGKSNFKKPLIFTEFSKDSEIEKIVTALKKMKKNSYKEGNKISLLQLDRFLLPVIFLLEPVDKSILIEVVSNAIEDEKNASSSTITALTTLTKKRYIQSTGNGYKLTQLGNNEFLSFRKKNSRYKQFDKTVAIDNLRLEILNLKNRKKKLKV